MSATPATAPGRDRALDVARGIAIVLIVLGHVLRGLSSSGDLEARAPWYEEVDTALYLVHLPVFFFVSALFLARGVRRHGRRDFLTRRLVVLAWVFVLWTLIQGGIGVLAGGATNERTTPRRVLEGLVHPLGQYWFLPTLAVLTLVTVLLAPWSSRGRALALLALATAVSLIRWGHFGTWSGTQAMGIALFFATGAVLGEELVRRFLRGRAGLLAGAFGLAAYAALLVLDDPSAPTDPYSAPVPATLLTGIIASVGGTLALLVLARVLAGLPGARPWAFLGRHSLQIFLVHIIAASGSRILLTRLGVEQPAFLAVLGVAAGLLAPLVLIALAPRVPWLFAPPAAILPRRRRAQPGTSAASTLGSPP